MSDLLVPLILSFTAPVSFFFLPPSPPESQSSAPDSNDIVCVTVQKDIPANQARKFVTFGSLLPPPASQSSEHPSGTHGGLRVSFPMEIAGGSSIIAPSHSGQCIMLSSLRARALISELLAASCLVAFSIPSKALRVGLKIGAFVFHCFCSFF